MIISVKGCSSSIIFVCFVNTQVELRILEQRNMCTIRWLTGLRAKEWVTEVAKIGQS